MDLLGTFPSVTPTNYTQPNQRTNKLKNCDFQKAQIIQSLSLSLSPLPAPMFNVCQLITTRIVSSCCISSNSKIMSHSFRLCGRRRRRITHRTVSWNEELCLFPTEKDFLESGRINSGELWNSQRFPMRARRCTWFI